MPVILPKGRETNWLRPSSHQSDILGILEIFPSDLMNAYPISKDIELPGPYTIDMLKPAGDRIYTEVEQKFIPQRQWGHKTEGCSWGNMER